MKHFTTGRTRGNRGVERAEQITRTHHNGMDRKEEGEEKWENTMMEGTRVIPRLRTHLGEDVAL